ncbi:hypothetical protein CERSUDRAFT_82988 [Gelatoporia subvermispora B]|uniref:Uncharacterized protein n=1 Tax=Ceriporiopsis subvermispora (strain B) TaxID=914234 RepID=M2REI4_CERS8|nr:hypothetical protein CERSUDRAFT_82988 [Gelatoporia subvermispora B]
MDVPLLSRQQAADVQLAEASDSLVMFVSCNQRGRFSHSQRENTYRRPVCDSDDVTLHPRLT